MVGAAGAASGGELMARQLHQNFRGRRAVVIAGEGGGLDMLAPTLVKLGLTVERPVVEDGVVRFDFSGLEPESDVLFVDGDLGRELPFEGQPGKLPPAPVIGLVGVEAPGRLKALMNHGATAFLRKPVYAGAVYTSLFLGVNQFFQRFDLEAELAEHQHRRKRRRAVVKAIVQVMETHAVDDDEAYGLLRRDSMRKRQGLEDYCEEYLSRPLRLPAETDAPLATARST